MTNYLESSINTIIHGNCLEEMQQLPASCIDLILIDPPYMVLQDTSEDWDHSWDIASYLDLANYVLKDQGYFFVFGLFTFLYEFYHLARSHFRFHFDLIWSKPAGVNYHMSKVKPMNQHEQILCLVKHEARVKSMVYNYKSIGTHSTPSRRSGGLRHNRAIASSMDYKPDYESMGYRYPTTVIESYTRNTMPMAERTVHPTQKPLKLLNWIIQGFTKKNDLVLDSFAGSGSTLVASKSLGRNYLGYELDPVYVDISKRRLRQEYLF